MCTQGSIWKYVNIGSGNGLMLSGTKPLPEPILTNIHDVIRPLSFNDLIKRVMSRPERAMTNKQAPSFLIAL